MAGVEAAWRIVVQIGSGQPELRAALAVLPVRARAERLRQLALVGLCNLRAAPAPASLAPEPQAPHGGALDERRERLLSGLRRVAD